MTVAEFSYRPTGKAPPWRNDFWGQVEKSGDCWVWLRGCTKGGYGRLRVDGKDKYAHRHAYELTYGAIPDGLLILHRCDNPPCVNPSHLFLGNWRDNSLDAVAKGRQRNQNMGKTVCKRGHALTSDNVYVIPYGGRECRTCRREVYWHGMSQEQRDRRNALRRERRRLGKRN